MNPDTPPATALPPRPGWWSRNWKWFVPTGCLTMLLLVACFLFLILSIVFGAIKSSDAYKTALAKAKADPRVMSALGSPITDGFFVKGTTNVSGTSGQADMTVPISGPKGKGTIYFVATKFAGQWSFSKLMVEIGATGQRIDLIEDPATTEP
jgi:Cytochrome oxidase complex assembly protein 1